MYYFKNLEDLRLHKASLSIVLGPIIDFNFPKLAKFWLFSTFTLRLFWDIEPQIIELHCLDSARGGEEALCGIGWNRTRTKQNVECTGHLFSAHVHYVIGNKNGWFLVSRQPQTLKKQIRIVFWLWFLQVIKSTSLGFEIQVFEVTANLKL